jgi:hypothetical protein
LESRPAEQCRLVGAPTVPAASGAFVYSAALHEASVPRGAPIDAAAVIATSSNTAAECRATVRGQKAHMTSSAAASVMPAITRGLETARTA